MVRRLVLVLFFVLVSCAAPSAAGPSVTPRPTVIELPTMAPVGATILPSDRSGTISPGDGGTVTPGATISPTVSAATRAATSQSPDNGGATPAPALTPSAARDFTYALRPEFAGDLKLVVNPTIYTMNWELNDDLSELKGSQQVKFTNRTGQALTDMYFRLFANYPGTNGKIDVTGARIGGKAVQPKFEVQETALRLPLEQALAPGASLDITLEYTIHVPAANDVRYSDFTRRDWITTLPSAYPIIPGFDGGKWHLELPPPYGDLVYAESSLYDVTVTAPARYDVIASGEQLQSVTRNDQTTRRFIAAPVRDFDLNLTDTLQRVSATVGDLTIRSWYRPEHAAQGRKALDWTVNSLKVYEERFGSYPFKKLDLVETPTTAGGIEYPTVITVNTGLYADPGQTNFFEFATAHETAHQWFYSVIGNDQINHPWLDEAMAQYATLVYAEEQYGRAQADTIQQLYFDQNYQRAREKYGDRPAGLPVSAYDENAYSGFVYGKGPKFFQAVRQQIGDELFFKALHTYYEDFRYQVAQPEDLVNTFNKVSGQDVTPLYNKWILGPP